jgi:hypothetical protein
VGLGRHPFNGMLLVGWSKAGDGTEGKQEGFLLGVPSPMDVGCKEEEDLFLVGRSEEHAGCKGAETDGHEVSGDWELWMEMGRSQDDEEEHQGEGFLGFDEP